MLVYLIAHDIMSFFVTNYFLEKLKTGQALLDPRSYRNDPGLSADPAVHLCSVLPGSRLHHIQRIHFHLH